MDDNENIDEIPILEFMKDVDAEIAKHPRKIELEVLWTENRKQMLLIMHTDYAQRTGKNFARRKGDALQLIETDLMMIDAMTGRPSKMPTGFGIRPITPEDVGGSPEGFDMVGFKSGDSVVITGVQDQSHPSQIKSIEIGEEE